MRSFGIIIFLSFLLFYSCKDNKIVDQNINKNITNKYDFHKCTNTKDTFFSNGNYVKYIPIDNNNYTIEIKISNVRDTLDFYLNCKTDKSSIPKLISESDYMLFLQGSTSYRYLTLCSYDKEKNKIINTKFKTAIDVSSEIDGFVFVKGYSLFFYDRDIEKLLSKRLTVNSLKIKESVLISGDSILITNEENEILKYTLKDFH